MQTPAYTSLPPSPAKGIALLELMLVLGVIAAATTAVVITYRIVDGNRKIQQDVDGAAAILQNIVDASAASPNFGGMNQSTAIRDGIFPTEMIDAQGQPHSAWGGPIYVSSIALNCQEQWGTVITFGGLPGNACAKFVSQAGAGFYSVKVNNTPVSRNFSPIDVPTLVNACNGEVVQVDFIYAKNGGTTQAGNPATPGTYPCYTPPTAAPPPAYTPPTTPPTPSVPPPSYPPPTPIPAPPPSVPPPSYPPPYYPPAPYPPIYPPIYPPTTPPPPGNAPPGTASPRQPRQPPVVKPPHP